MDGVKNEANQSTKTGTNEEMMNSFKKFIAFSNFASLPFSRAYRNRRVAILSAVIALDHQQQFR